MRVLTFVRVFEERKTRKWLLSVAPKLRPLHQPDRSFGRELVL